MIIERLFSNGVIGVEGEQKHFWLFVITGALVNVTALGFGRLSYGVVMPFMREGLSLSYAQAGMLGTFTAIGYLAMVIFAGLLTAYFGAKKLIVLGGSIVTASLGGLTLVPSYGWALAMMFLSGLGTALTFTPMLALLVGWFPHRRGVVAGSMSSGAGIATFITGGVVPWLVQSFPEWGWRAVWGVFGLCGCLIIVWAAMILKDPPVPVSQGKQPKYNLASAVYRKKTVLLVAAVYFLAGVAYLVPTTFTVGFMLTENIDADVAGKIVAMGGLLSIISGPLWGMVSDRIERRKALVIALCIFSLGTGIPVLLPNFWGFLLGQILLGCTVGGMLSLIQAAATEQVPSLLVGVALGYVTVFFAVGQLIGPGTAGWMIDHFAGFRGAFLFAMGSTVIAMLFAGKIRGEKEFVVSIPQPECKSEVV